MSKIGKLITIEGTDCSGKETQTNRLIERLISDNVDVFKYYYPHYEDPTGRIVGGPYLGKKHIGEGFFKEGAANVDPKVASLYYGADFRYSLPLILEKLESGTNVVLDRYMFSSFAHQGGKIQDKDKRLEAYKWLDKLFFELLELKKPDLTILLYMPYQYAVRLKAGRAELPDQHEASEQHLKDAENAYLEVAELYNFKVINCIKDDKIRSIDEIHEEVYEIIKNELEK